MKLEMKLTDRDKKLLLIILAAAVLGSYYYFGLKPTMESIDTLTLQEEDLQTRQQQMVMTISQIPTLEKGLEDAKDEYEEAISDLFSMRTNEEVDAYLTSILVDHELYVSDLTIRDAELLEIAPYSLSNKALMLPDDEEIVEDETMEENRNASLEKLNSMDPGVDSADTTGTSSDTAETEAVQTATKYVYSCAVNVTCSGTRTQMMDLLDLLAETDGLRVVSFSFSDGTQQNVGEDGEEDTYEIVTQMNLNLVMYMCKK